MMVRVQWTTDDFVYVPQLDAEHRKLFQELERLRQAVMLGTSASRAGFPLWRLSKTLSLHLASEERLMRSSRYPALQWHQRQHDAGRAKMAFLMKAIQERDEPGIADAFEELAGWMQDHVRLADRMFAAHLRNDRRERLAS